MYIYKKKIFSGLLVLALIMQIILAVPATIAYAGAGTVTALGSGFSGPTGVAVDINGNIYVADYGNSAIKRMDASGGNITVLGSGFCNPTGVAVDSSGNIYVADTNSNTIKRMDASGNNITVLGSGFYNPTGVAVDSIGNIYVADNNNCAIKRMDASGNNITVLGSGFNYPSGVAVDISGNIYVADYGNGAVKRMDANGNNITALGSGFSGPIGVAVDNNGNIYVADNGNSAINKMDANGNNITALGSGSGSPFGVAVDNNGIIYVADRFNNAVKKISDTVVNALALDLLVTAPVKGVTPSTTAIDQAQYTGTVAWYQSDGTTAVTGNFATSTVYVAKVTLTAKTGYTLTGVAQNSFTYTGATSVANAADSGTVTITFLTMSPITLTSLGSGFNKPFGVAVDSSGNIYVADTNSNTIKRMDASGGNITVLGSGFNKPFGVAVDSSGNIYVSNNGDNTVKRMDASGGNITVLGSGFNKPTGVAVDSSGNIYVADQENYVVKRMDASGNNITVLGSGFAYPTGVAVDSSGNIYVADLGNNAIKRMDASGKNITVLGSGFNYPSGVAVDSSGNICVADQGNSAIKRMDASGKNITALGSGFNYPVGVALDSSGNIYVADQGNNAVKKISFETETVNALSLDSVVAAPVKGATPSTAAIVQTQYNGTVAWYQSDGTTAVTGNFATSTVYVAKVTLTAKTGYTLTGVAQNSFTYTGATSVANAADSGTVTITFPATGAILSSDATLTSVLSQTITAGSEAGTGAAPKTASINVANTVATVAATDVVKHDAGATVTFYGKSSTYASVETDSVNLTAGVGTDIYIKVVATDNTTQYYKVTVNRLALSSYTVNYKSNYNISDTTIYATQTVVSGNKAAAPGQPIRSGYTFEGWYTEVACINAWNFKNNLVTGDTDLYAKWVAIAYTNSATTSSTHSSGGDKSYTINAMAGTGGSIDPKGSVSVTAGKSKTYTITVNQGYYISDVLVDGKSVGAVANYTFSNISATHTIEAVFTKAAGLPYYIDDKGNKVFIGFASDVGGTMKYIAPPEKTVMFKENPKIFTDIYGHWAKSDIDFVTERELFLGTGSNTFSPETGMTRAMLVTVIGRLYERSYGKLATTGTESKFSDADYTAYYGNYVDWAAENNIITGVGGGQFEPERKVTREEMAVMLYRFAKFLKISTTELRASQLSYPDASVISAWATDAAKYCQQSGIISGRYGGNFAPKGTATRAEVAAILQNEVFYLIKR